MRSIVLLSDKQFSAARLRTEMREQGRGAA